MAYRCLGRKYEDEDDAYDSWRQRMVDALAEGEQAGRDGTPAEKCPYYPFEPYFNEWHQGRAQELEKRNG